MSALDIIKGFAPAIATALGGPLAGAAVSFLADKLGVSEPTQEKIQQTLSGMTGADLVKMKEMDIEFQKFMLDNGIKLDLAQIEVNKEEAKSESTFVAGGRPACIWIGAVGLGYAAFFEPLMRFVSTVVFGYTGDFPIIDTSVTTTVLFGILGLGGLRSVDKWKQSSKKGKE